MAEHTSQQSVNPPSSRDERPQNNKHSILYIVSYTFASSHPRQCTT